MCVSYGGWQGAKGAVCDKQGTGTGKEKEKEKYEIRPKVQLVLEM